MENLVQNKEAIRQQIFGIEDFLKTVDGCHIGDSDYCPLKHHFTDGIYTREIFIPKDSYVVGKIHKHEHPNFLMKGKVRMITEDGGFEEIEAPKFMISPAGTKRALYVLEDTVWITIHHNKNNKKDLEKIEDFVIAKDYNEYDKFLKSKKIKVILKNPLNIFNKLLTKGKRK
jgi:hypothetical protein